MQPETTWRRDVPHLIRFFSSWKRIIYVTNSKVKVGWLPAENDLPFDVVSHFRLSHSRLRSNPKSISLEWDSPLNCLHMRNNEKYLSHLSGIPPVLKWDLTSVGSYESNHFTI